MKNQQTLQGSRQAKSPKSLLPLVAGIALALSFSSQSQAGLITDGGFLSAPQEPISVNSVIQNDAKDVWQTTPAGKTDTWEHDDTNKNLVIHTFDKYRGLIQVITNTTNAIGLLDFSIDSVITGTGNMNIEVWGIDAADSYVLDVAAGTGSSGPNSDSIGNIDLLASTDLTSQLGGTATASFDIGATNYAFLALRINAFGWDIGNGDSLVIDNVSLEVQSTNPPIDPPVPAPAAALLLLSGLIGFSMKNHKQKTST